MAEAKLCAVEGCGKPMHARGFCKPHYKKLLRYGDATHKERVENGEAERWIKSHLNWAGSECLIWPYWRDKNGYGPSRKMCEAAHGKAPDPNMQAAHSCGRGHDGCVNPSHLRWATRIENQQEMVAHGNSNRGEKNPMTSLSEGDVCEIRRCALSASQVQVARQFGVTQGTVSRIVRRETWGWLD